MTGLNKKDEKINALLQATLQLINSNGFHAAPMSKIAKMAEISVGSIYLYFESKQDLVNSLYLKIKEEFTHEIFKDFSEEDDVYVSFKKIWHNAAKYKISNQQEAFFLSQCDNSPIVEEKVIEEALFFLEPLLNLWRKGMEANILKHTSPYLLYSYTIYPLNFLLHANKRQLFELNEENLNIAFQMTWDSIKK